MEENNKMSEKDRVLKIELVHYMTNRVKKIIEQAIESQQVEVLFKLNNYLNSINEELYELSF